jgi:hypothetical protein
MLQPAYGPGDAKARILTTPLDLGALMIMEQEHHRGHDHICELPGPTAQSAVVSQQIAAHAGLDLRPAGAVAGWRGSALAGRSGTLSGEFGAEDHGTCVAIFRSCGAETNRSSLLRAAALREAQARDPTARRP